MMNKIKTNCYKVLGLHDNGKRYSCQVPYGSALCYEYPVGVKVKPISVKYPIMVFSSLSLALEFKDHNLFKWYKTAIVPCEGEFVNRFDYDEVGLIKVDMLKNVTNLIDLETVVNSFLMISLQFSLQFSNKGLRPPMGTMFVSELTCLE